jgi:hypothetical protein
VGGWLEEDLHFHQRIKWEEEANSFSLSAVDYARTNPTLHSASKKFI